MGLRYEGSIHMDPDQSETHYNLQACQIINVSLFRKYERLALKQLHILSLSRKYIEDKILLIHS